MTPEAIAAINEATAALAAVSATKAGWKTSEFWLTVAVNLVGLGLQVGACFAADPRVQIALVALGAIQQVLATLGYKNGRNVIKSPTPPATLPEALALSAALGAGKTKDSREG